LSKEAAVLDPVFKDGPGAAERVNEGFRKSLELKMMGYESQEIVRVWGLKK
jgi:hypothetical protein